jgi:site-specific recombinase XerD
VSGKSKSKKIESWECEGLLIYVRGTTFHVRGTVSVGKRSERVRETLKIKAIKENRQDAEGEVRKILGPVRARLGGGVVRKAVSTLVAERFQAHTGPSDKRILGDFTRKFTTRILFDIPPEVIIEFVEERHRGDPSAGKPANKPETRERYISGLCAFLSLQAAAGQYPEVPAFKRDQKARNPTRRARRDVENVDKRLLGYLFRASHSTIAAQLNIQYVGGTRVSSVLHGCRLKDLDLRAMTLMIRETKNGEDVPIALPSDIKPTLQTYLDWRQQQVQAGRVGPGSNEPLFLTYKGKPYKPNDGGWGTQNKTGFNAAKKRAIKDISKDYDEAISAATAAGDVREADKLRRSKDDDVTLMRKFTQHWFRHLFATDAGRKDLRAAMAQGGWLDARSVTGYLISDAEYQRDVVEQRGSPASVRKAG